MRKINKIVSIIIAFAVVFTTVFIIAPKSFAVDENTSDYSVDDVQNEEFMDKFDKGLNELIPGEDFVENEILIKYKSDLETQSLGDISDELELNIECNLDSTETINTCSADLSNAELEDGLYLATINENDTALEVVQELSAYDCIEYAQPNYIYKTCEVTNQFITINENEPKGFQSQQAMFNTLNMGDTNYTGTGVVVAVIDTGIDLDHPALSDCFWSDNGVVGYNTANINNITEITMSQSTIYTNSHGTHVAGIIAMKQKENFTCKGIAPNAKIMDLQASYSDGNFKTASIIKALELAEEHGADIVNMSLGREKYDYALNLACNKAARKMTLIAAAGNNGNDRETFYPAAFSSVIGVMAYGGSQSALKYDNCNLISDNLSFLKANYPSSGFMTLAKFSNYDSKNKYFDIVAPGVNICSTKARTEDEKKTEDFTDYSYIFNSGTSMASPIIAGVAALYLEKNSSATPGQVRNALRQDSGKKVKYFDCLNEIKNVPSNKLIPNQVDVSTILSRIPDSQIDVEYIHNSDESYADFCQYVKKQFKYSILNEEVITNEDIRLISSLRIHNFFEIQSFYNQLSEFSNLTSLYFYSSSFDDSNLNPILNNNSFNKLDILVIQNTDIFSLKLPKKTCPTLYNLSLEDNHKLKTISSLSGLNDLSIVKIDNGNVENIDFVVGLCNIKDLFIINNKVTDLTPLSCLTSIVRVAFDNNYITNITPISNLTNLIFVSFSNNYISNFLPIKNLIEVAWVYLDDNLIDNLDGLDSILALPKLYRLNIQNNPLKSKELEIEAFLKSESFMKCKFLVTLMYKPFKEKIFAEDILAYNCIFKRTNLYYNPKIEVFPYNASSVHNVKLNCIDEKIKVNPYSNTLAYNDSYQYNVESDDFESIIDYQCDGISGSFTASLLMPTIISAGFENYHYDKAELRNYVTIRTTVDTTKVKIAPNSSISSQTYEYSLLSDGVTYNDYGQERIIKIELNDSILTDNSISVTAGDDIGYFATKTVSANQQVDIFVENSIVNSIYGSADLVLISSSGNDNIVGIETNSLKNNCSISTLILSNSISNIKSNAFNNCNISELYIMNKCLNADNSIFNNCEGMTVYVSQDSPIADFTGANINSNFKYSCNGRDSMLIQYFGNESKVVLPKYLSINNIASGAFENNTYLTEINISDSITQIGDFAFKGCVNLSNIGGVLNLSQIGTESFKDTKIKDIIIKCDKNLDLNKSSVFEDCNELRLISIIGNKSISSIGSKFFKNCNTLKFISLENDIKVCESCFENCNSLKTFPFDKIRSIGKSAFRCCSNLSGEVYYWGDSILDDAFSSCSKIKSISFKNDIEIGSNVFWGTTSLKTIGFISKNNTCRSNSFSGCNNELIIYTNGYSLTNGDTEKVFSNSEITICPDYKLVLNSYGDIMLTEYAGTATDIHIPECLKIYGIGEKAFYCKQFIRSVYIPDSVEYIDEKAFSMDMNLETLKGGKNVLFIKDDAFYNCKKLKDISSMESIYSIGEYSFSWTGIESLSLPQTITTIEDCAFFCCKQLKEIELPSMCSFVLAGCFYLCENLERCIINDRCRKIMDSAFFGCTKLNHLYLPISVNTIENDSLPSNTIVYCEPNASFIDRVHRSFGNTVIPNYKVFNKTLIDYQSSTGYDYIDSNNQKVIEIPNVVEEIRSSEAYFGGVFKDNREAQTYILPKYLKVIDQNSFYNSWANKIIMPNNMQYIGANAFNKCTSLKEITIPDGLETIETNTFFQTRCVGYKIPNSVTEIKSGAFWHCDLLKSVYIPDTVTNIASNAFADCNDNLVIYGHNSSYLNEYVQNNSNKNGNNNLVYKSGYNVNGNIFTSYDGNEEAVQIPYGIGLSRIADEAFKNNTFVKSVSIASGITHIGENCFENCTSLKAVVIPDDVESIGDNAFNGLSGVTVYCNSGSFAEDYCIKNNITVVTDYDVRDGVLNKYNGSETNVVIPDNLCLVEIGRNSFYNINNVQSIIIPEGVTAVGINAIYRCNNLTTVTLPTTIQKLNFFAICYNPMLTVVNNSEFIKDIGSYAFSGCDSLNTLNLSGVKKLSDNVFNNCDSLTNVTIGREATSVDYRAFDNCDNVSIYCYENSYIHQFAIDNNISYILLVSDATNETESNYTNVVLKTPIRNVNENSLAPTEEEFLENYISDVYNREVTDENIEEIVNYMVSNGWWL
mgnify:FL=1